VSIRHGDGRLTLSRRWLVCVEEQVGPEETTHRLVAVDTSGSRRVIDLAGGTDFVAAPRPSPDGRWLAWVGWDHPAMPWDRSSLFVAELVESGDEVALGSHRHIAGGPGDGGSSVGQPRWCRDGALLFVDDRTGWWLPYRLPGDVLEAGATGTGPMPAYPLVDREAEFHDPDWALGQSTMAELSDGSLVCRVRESGRDRVVRLVPPPGPDRSPWSEEAVAQPCVSISGLAVSPPTGGPDGEYVVILGSTTTEAHVVIEVAAGASSEPDRGDTPVTDGSGTTEVVRRLSARSSPPVPADEVSVAVPFTAARGALDIPGHLFLPTNPSTTGPAGQLPPLVVFCHGGPTGSTDAGFDPVIQFFTGLGLAVAAVDYRGSSGYGRAYRRALAGLWGEADVDDCVAYASALGEAGLVDPGRMAIRGSSAGGLTALGALIRSDRFAGAVSWYGVTDLAALAGDTHDFESRYLDSLVGPWPEASAVYRDRSPIHQVEAMTGAVLLFQGADDPVVPLDQSERLAAIAASAGIPCSLTVFAGESHGFKRPETIEACLEAELSFYRRLFAGEAGIGGTAPSV
jgi:dipeptidyl aminopeptidase/acylaminoacyl peptidase